MSNHWRLYFGNWLSVLGLVILVLLVLVAAFGPALLVPHDPEVPRDRIEGHPARRGVLAGYGRAGPGTCSAGPFRGSCVSLLVGVVAAAGSTLLGIIIGSMAGYFGGLLDHVLMRITEVFQVVPQFFLAGGGSSAVFSASASSTSSWPSRFLTLRRSSAGSRGRSSCRSSPRQYVDAARLSGASDTIVIFREILPNAMGPNHRGRDAARRARDADRGGAQLPGAGRSEPSEPGRHAVSIPAVHPVRLVGRADSGAC